jgi:hypothetical protein
VCGRGRTKPAGVATAWDEWGRSGKDMRALCLSDILLADGFFFALMASEVVVVLLRRACVGLEAVGGSSPLPSDGPPGRIAREAQGPHRDEV